MTMPVVPSTSNPTSSPSHFLPSYADTTHIGQFLRSALPSKTSQSLSNLSLMSKSKSKLDKIKSTLRSRSLLPSHLKHSQNGPSSRAFPRLLSTTKGEGHGVYQSRLQNSQDCMSGPVAAPGRGLNTAPWPPFIAHLTSIRPFITDGAFSVVFLDVIARVTGGMEVDVDLQRVVSLLRALTRMPCLVDLEIAIMIKRKSSSVSFLYRPC